VVTAIIGRRIVPLKLLRVLIPYSHPLNPVILQDCLSWLVVSDSMAAQ
jgi:hypothetical protein